MKRKPSRLIALNQKVGRLWAGALCLLLFLPTGCTLPMTKEPSAVIETFYQAAIQGKIEETRQYYPRRPILIEGLILDPLSGQSKDLRLWPAADDPPLPLDRITRNGTLVGVEVTQVRIVGDLASCRVAKRYKDGTRQELTVELIRDRATGTWRIDSFAL